MFCQGEEKDPGNQASPQMEPPNPSQMVETTKYFLHPFFAKLPKWGSVRLPAFFSPWTSTTKVSCIPNSLWTALFSSELQSLKAPGGFFSFLPQLQQTELRRVTSLPNSLFTASPVSFPDPFPASGPQAVSASLTLGSCLSHHHAYNRAQSLSNFHQSLQLSCHHFYIFTSTQ